MSMLSLYFCITMCVMATRQVWTYSACDDKKYLTGRDNLSVKSQGAHGYHGNKIMKCASKCLGAETCNFFYIGPHRNCMLRKSDAWKKADYFPKAIWPQRLLRSFQVTDERHTYKSSGTVKNSMKPSWQNTTDPNLKKRKKVFFNDRTKMVSPEKVSLPTNQAQRTTEASAKILPKATLPITTRNKTKPENARNRFKTVIMPEATKHSTKPQKQRFHSKPRAVPTRKNTNLSHKHRGPSTKGHCKKGYTRKHLLRKGNRKHRWAVDPMCLKIHNGVDEKVTWERAAFICKAETGRLVVAKEKIKFKLVKQFMKYNSGIVTGIQNWIGNRAWIGLKSHQWIDVTNITYARFEDKADRRGHGCVSISMRKKLYWRREPCNTPNYFICEI